MDPGGHLDRPDGRDTRRRGAPRPRYDHESPIRGVADRAMRVLRGSAVNAGEFQDSGIPSAFAGGGSRDRWQGGQGAH